MRSFARSDVLFLTLICAIMLSANVQGANLKVDCGRKGALSTISRALKLLNPRGPNTLTVSGSCYENVVIQTFDNLTLIAGPGASINDASGGTADVVFIYDSQRITLQNFTINGGSEGMICVSHSLCRFSGNTIQGSAGPGISISRARAEFSGDIVQNNAEEGMLIREASQAITEDVTIQGNGAAGIRVNDASFLHAVSTTVQNNGGNGMLVSNHSTLRSRDNKISGNGSNGIVLDGGSEARFLDGNVITGNSGNGVNIGDLSFGNFEVPGNNVTGNLVQPDVVCSPQFSATRGALVNIGGTTNCNEP